MLGITLQENTKTTHSTLGVPTHRSPSVGEVGEQITASSIQRVSKSTEGSALVYLKKEREREREREKREGETKKRKKKYRKKEKKKKEKKREKWARRGVRVNLQDPHESKGFMCIAFKPWPYTENHSAVKLHPSLLSLTLAKPRHNPHPLLALQSATLAARAHTPEECSSSGTGLCYSSPFGTHSHTWKETYFAPPIIVPMEHASKAQAHIKNGEVIDNQIWPCHLCSNIKTSILHAGGKCTQVCNPGFTNLHLNIAWTLKFMIP